MLSIEKIKESVSNGAADWRVIDASPEEVIKYLLKELDASAFGTVTKLTDENNKLRDKLDVAVAELDAAEDRITDLEIEVEDLLSDQVGE